MKKSKRFIITGVSGVGKSTLIKSINEFKTYKEYLDDIHVKFWYELSEKSDKTDHNAKNVMLLTRLSKLAHEINNFDEVAVFDRGLIDLMVASQLRIKPKDKELHKWFIKKIEEVLLANKPTLIIYLKISWEEFKARIIARGRKKEVAHLIEDNSWYKNYFNSYETVFKTYCKKFDLKYKIFEVSENQPEQTKMMVLETINNYV